MGFFETHRRVEFRDTDAAGIAHFSSLLVYMEQAEHDLFRSLELSVFPQHRTGDEPCQSGPDAPPVTWPRVHISMDFLGPARFEDLLTIQVEISRLGATSVSFEHKISGPSGDVAKGTSISVCCQIESETTHRLIKRSIPDSIREKLSQFVKGRQ
jgi:4-hydroxybenzoyl-CoA thioesterase/acyl-CoA thioester hydrolase